MVPPGPPQLAAECAAMTTASYKFKKNELTKLKLNLMLNRQIPRRMGIE